MVRNNLATKAQFCRELETTGIPVSTLTWTAQLPFKKEVPTLHLQTWVKLAADHMNKENALVESLVSKIRGMLGGGIKTHQT